MSTLFHKLKTIQTPPFSEACKNTIMIVIAAVIVAAITAGFDLGTSKLVNLILSLFV